MDKRAIQLERFDKLLSATYWTDCNFQTIRYALRTSRGVSVRGPTRLRTATGHPLRVAAA